MDTEKAVPGEGEAGPEPTKLPYEDGEGHNEADAPDEHAPVNYVPLQSVLTGPQREGHTVESSCPSGGRSPRWAWRPGLRTW